MDILEHYSFRWRGQWYCKISTRFHFGKFWWVNTGCWGPELCFLVDMMKLLNVNILSQN